MQTLVGGASLASLFSTHPPIPKRIERLIGEGAAAFYTAGIRT